MASAHCAVSKSKYAVVANNIMLADELVIACAEYIER